VVVRERALRCAHRHALAVACPQRRGSASSRGAAGRSVAALAIVLTKPEGLDKKGGVKERCLRAGGRKRGPRPCHCEGPWRWCSPLAELSLHSWLESDLFVSVMGSTTVWLKNPLDLSVNTKKPKRRFRDLSFFQLATFPGRKNSSSLWGFQIPYAGSE